ncbi:hypothetical protein GCM10018793_34430 [Streptomyces sulfonofaciens]|uniref:Uncharacterized protein n=1 Tax=Streptomyces sulfonofaciens TaxID=68272 RepID=A0A919G9N2_9ACTN|nr:hypothetical protein GCM10018793_34430 [Streptomyces sulfonofaciens]
MPGTVGPRTPADDAVTGRCGRRPAGGQHERHDEERGGGEVDTGSDEAVGRRGCVGSGRRPRHGHGERRHEDDGGTVGAGDEQLGAGLEQAGTAQDQAAVTGTSTQPRAGEGATSPPARVAITRVAVTTG